MEEKWSLKELFDTSEKPDGMPEEIWATYRTYLLINSLNAAHGMLHKSKDKTLQQFGYYVEKAEEVIRILLEETGRAKDYEDWENSGGSISRHKQVV